MILIPAGGESGRKSDPPDRRQAEGRPDLLSPRRKAAGQAISQLLLRLAMLLLTASAGLLILESCNRGGKELALLWFAEHPGLTLVSLFLLSALALLFYSCCPRPAFASAVYLSLCCLLGFAHYYKSLYKGEPLLPMDIFYIKEAALIAPSLDLKLEPFVLKYLLLVAAVVFALCLARRFLWRPLPWRWYVSLPAGAAAAVLMLLLFFQPGFQSAFQLEDMRYYQNKNFDWQGFVIASAYNFQALRLTPGEGYTEAAMVTQARAALALSEAVPAPLCRPHIIVLMMESYADPRQLDPGFVLTPDPFSPLERHKDQIQTFRLLSSVYGGSTSNTEFEFLSGLSMAHLPAGSMPYAQYVRGVMPALPSDLAALGYQTVSIHPNRPDFYNRQNVYESFGFEEFLSLEDFADPVYHGYFVSEQSFSNKIKETFAERAPSGPLFCFGVSIANHGPYGTTGLVRDYDIGGHTDFLSDSQYKELTSGAANLLDSSNMLAELMDYLDSQEEPVLLIAFGDHHPNWSWLEADPDACPDQSRYLTEGLIWSNRPLPALGLTFLSANFLSSQLLRLTDLALPPFYQAMALQARRLKAYNPYYYIDNRDEAHPLDAALVKEAGLLAYDRLFGEDYLDAAFQELAGQP